MEVLKTTSPKVSPVAPKLRPVALASTGHVRAVRQLRVVVARGVRAGCRALARPDELMLQVGAEPEGLTEAMRQQLEAYRSALAPGDSSEGALIKAPPGGCRAA